MKKLIASALFCVLVLACRSQTNPINNLVIQGSGTALSGIPKMNGASAVTTAVPGTDYGNVNTSGSPTSGQTAEFSSTTAITGIANTGTGSYVKATSPTIATPSISSATFTGTSNIFNFGAANPFLSSANWGGDLVGISGDDSGNSGQLVISTWAGNDSSIFLFSSNGTSTSPTATTNGNTLGEIDFIGNTNTTPTPAFSSSIQALAAENWTPSAEGSQITFSTTPNGSTTPAAALTLGSNQSASIGGTGDSTSTSTGSLVTAGGAGIAKSLYVGGSASILGGVGIGGSVNAGHIVDFIQPTTGPGTISVTASSGSVTGSGTSFFSTFRVGQTITANSETHTITGVSSNTALTTDNWTNSASTQAYTLAGGLKAFISGNGELNFGSASAGIAFPIGDTAIQVVRTATDLGSTSADIYTYYTGDILSETRAAFTGQLIGYASTPQIGGSNTQNWTQSTFGGGIVGGLFSPSFGALGGSGNVTTASAIYAKLHIGTANNLTNGYGLWVEKFHTDGSAWTNAVGVAIDDQNAGTNNTDLLLGTVTAPTGNYALYSASIYPSAFAGPVSSSSTIQPIVTIVSSLPSASPAGQMACVTDASTTVALGLGLVVTGGGANFSPVYSDGINWRQY